MAATGVAAAREEENGNGIRVPRWVAGAVLALGIQFSLGLIAWGRTQEQLDYLKQNVQELRQDVKKLLAEQRRVREKDE